MKKLVLLIVWAIFVAILSGLGYYYYRMNFANILIKIKPSETYSYSVNLIEVIDMDIQHDGSLSKQEEDTLKQEFKYFVQKELKGAINDISDFSVLIECKLKFIPKVLEQNYIKEAKVMTERCYEKVAGRIQDYSNREYEVSDKKADIFKPLIDIPYCLDFCDGKKIKKGQTIEGMVYSKYINERLKEVFDDGAIATKLVPGKLEYKVEDIDWNTVKLKLSG